MSSHEHHGPVPAPRVAYAVWATAAFWLGFVSLLLVIVYRFAPLGFMLALAAFPAAVFGVVQARVNEVSAKIALPGVACAAVTVAIWLLARHEWPHVMGGDATWPDWVMGH